MMFVLIFGKDNAILSAIPYHGVDALVRIEDVERYDDRETIRTNLIETYDRIMAFVVKHLPDKFYLEKGLSISVRNHIFREVVSNMLIHREYLDASPSRFIIERDRVYIENAHKPHRHHGLIDPQNYSPYPKNPSIAQIFREIRLADQLGSGVRKLFKYGKFYCGEDPQLLEEEVFKVILPLKLPKSERIKTEQATEQAAEHDDKIKNLVEFCAIPRSRREIHEFLGLKHREYVRAEILTPLIGQGLLKLTIPDKPKSPKQKYYSEKQEGHDGSH